MTIGVLYLVGVALVAALAYAGSCWLFPFGRCWWPNCDGGRRYRKKDRKVWRDCWWCRGSGRRLRIGRRAWNYFARNRKAASRGQR